MKTLFSVLVLFTLVSCSTKSDQQKLDAKTQQETSVSDAPSLGRTIVEVIQSSETLTVAQKKELEVIIDANRALADSLKAESYKLRAVLIKELLAGKANKKEVRLIEKNIRRVEKARLKNTFDTVKKITSIVSQESDKHRYEEALIFMERPMR